MIGDLLLEGKDENRLSSKRLLYERQYCSFNIYYDDLTFSALILSAHAHVHIPIADLEQVVNIRIATSLPIMGDCFLLNEQLFTPFTHNSCK